MGARKPCRICGKKRPGSRSFCHWCESWIDKRLREENSDLAEHIRAMMFMEGL